MESVAPLHSIWSSNWARNFDNIIEWADTASTFCSVSPSDYAHFRNHRADQIRDTYVKTAVCKNGPFFGVLLEWIQRGLVNQQSNVRVPGICIIEPIELTMYSSAWNKHVAGDRQSLSELKQRLEQLTFSMRRKRADIVDEDSAEYSSYSDYSEDETDSEEEDELDILDVSDTRDDVSGRRGRRNTESRRKRNDD